MRIEKKLQKLYEYNTINGEKYVYKKLVKKFECEKDTEHIYI